MTVTSSKSASKSNRTEDEIAEPKGTKVAVSPAKGTARTAELPDAEPPEKLSSLASEYIGLSIAGGLVVGLLIGALFPRAAARKLAKRSGALAAVAGEVGAALAAQALARAGNSAREGRDKVVDMGEAIVERSADARATANRLIGDGSARARDGGRALARKAAEMVSKTRS